MFGDFNVQLLCQETWSSVKRTCSHFVQLRVQFLTYILGFIPRGRLTLRALAVQFWPALFWTCCESSSSPLVLSAGREGDPWAVWCFWDILFRAGRAGPLPMHLPMSRGKGNWCFCCPHQQRGFPQHPSQNQTVSLQILPRYIIVLNLWKLLCCLLLLSLWSLSAYFLIFQTTIL